MPVSPIDKRFADFQFIFCEQQLNILIMEAIF